MSIQVNIPDLIASNDKAIEACNLAIERLEEIVGLPASDEHARLAQLSRATNQVTQLEQINANLRASETTVKALDENLANQLNDLGNTLDEQIANDEIADATVSFITDVLTNVDKIRGITGAS
jgi:hypothetical protein